MKPFKLLNLPHLIFRKIAKQINLIWLALCSRKSRLAVKSTKIKPNVYHINHLRNSHFVFLDFKIGFWIFWLFKKQDEFIEWTDCDKEFKIGDQCIKIRNRSEDYYASLCSDYYTASDQFIEFMKETFDCEPIGYHISPVGCLNYREFIIEKVNNSSCRSLEFGEVFLNFGEEKMIVEAEDLEFVFNNVRKDIELRISCYVRDGYHREELPNFKHLTVRHPEWFGKEAVFKSRCENLTLEQDKNLKMVDMNLYLKQWINGEHPELLYLKIDSVWLDSIHKEGSSRLLLDGIPTEPFNTTRNPIHYKRTRFPTIHTKTIRWEYYVFWDIKRKDGTVGSIALASNCFIFNVWHLLV